MCMSRPESVIASWYDSGVKRILLEELTAPWRKRAACLGAPVEWWVPSDLRNAPLALRKAVDTCGRCRVQAECLDYAKGLPDSARRGVLGGVVFGGRGRALPLSSL